LYYQKYNAHTLCLLRKEVCLLDEGLLLTPT
jgi:hypothetical protein